MHGFRMRLTLPRQAFRVAQQKKRAFDRRNGIRKYLRSGRVPWTIGYSDYRNDVIHGLLKDPQALELFRSGGDLPASHGIGLDERVVEYPWVFSRLTSAPSHLFDAGSTLNFPNLLDLPVLKQKRIVIYTLAPESFSAMENVSYLFGDLRDTILRDSVFEEIVCISTLEHVGMDNTRIYTGDQRFHEHRTSDFRRVMTELRRLLAPGGRLLLTVPFGAYQDFGWLQQFDRTMLEDAIRVFNGRTIDLTVYRYLPTGWGRSNLDGCRDCEYHDPHGDVSNAADGAAAARSVACVHLER